jgi:hypothetical protein
MGNNDSQPKPVRFLLTRYTNKQEKIMSLHDAIENDIHELQDLLPETDEGKLLDKAAKLWG